MIQFYSFTSIINDAYELSRWYPGDHKIYPLEWWSFADLNFFLRLNVVLPIMIKTAWSFTFKQTAGQGRPPRPTRGVSGFQQSGHSSWAYSIWKAWCIYNEKVRLEIEVKWLSLSFIIDLIEEFLLKSLRLGNEYRITILILDRKKHTESVSGMRRSHLDPL